ncbi:hypothetical protein ACFE04_025216 [Oxalis oulophora]
MVNVSMVEEKLPPGFRFHPRDEELVCDYLMKKITRCESLLDMLIEVDLNKCEPWDIPETACVGGKEWYFYSQRDRKYATGSRTNRATATGYWKATGKDREVLRKGTLVGMRKSLVFYQGRAPKGRKTNWIMHEFRLEGPLASAPINKDSSVHEDWVLCRVFYKNREVIAKPNMGINYENTNSSYLPPLMDSSNYLAFDHSTDHHQQSLLFDHNNYYDHDEQVPCLSNIFTYSSSQNNINSIFTSNKDNMRNDASGQISTSSSSIVDDVLSRYLSTKMETGINLDVKPSPLSSLGEGISSDHEESFLSEVGVGWVEEVEENTTVVSGDEWRQWSLATVVSGDSGWLVTVVSDDLKLVTAATVVSGDLRLATVVSGDLRLVTAATVVSGDLRCGVVLRFEVSYGDE